LFLAVVLVALFAAVGFNQPNYSELKRQGQEIVDQVQDFHRDHGYYPKNPEAAGIALPVTRFGQWQYEVVERNWEIVDGQLAGTPVKVCFHVKLSTKLLPRAPWRPYFTLSWMSEWDGWRFSTDPC
jgi:hypothetical protein